ncbi:MAG: HEPN domain-containing protein [Gemmataceae bacterium]|nr:HEPN domain-containing protein [Gemmataceae bacterium]
MNPREFLLLAEELVAGDTEAHWRSATSRAYYAAFHVARQLMEQCGFAVPAADRAHRYLSDWLSNGRHAATTQAGRWLDILRRHRNEADYDLWRTLSRSEVEDMVSLAERIILALEAAAADDAVRAAITLAMRAYEAGRGESSWRA